MNVTRMVGRFRLRYRIEKPPAESGLTTPCYLWTGAVDADGYGRIGTNRSGTFLAHRISYESKHGPIPDGMLLDHLCRRRRCIQDAHLEPVTVAENTRRGASTPLTWDDIAEIRRRRAAGESRGELAAAFKITTNAVAGILRGSRWSNETP